MFQITAHKGFQITFSNGCTLSVQFGPGNYCSRRNAEFDDPRQTRFWKSKDAEAAILLPNGDFYPIARGDGSVAGWLTVEDVVALIDVARNIDTSGYPKNEEVEA